MNTLPQLPRRKHQWVLDVLSRSAAYGGEDPAGVFRFELEGRLREIVGKERLTCTFQKRLVDDGVELAAPGSWLHDQLLRYSEEWGRAVHLYVPVDSGLDRDGILAKAGLPAGRTLVETRYQVLLRYSFRVVFYTAPLVHDLVSYMYDPVKGKCYKRLVSKDLLTAARSVPEEGVTPGFIPNCDKAFTTAWKSLTKDVEDRIQKLQEDRAKHFEDNMTSLKRYYRQLIADEAGGRHGRPKNAQEAQEKTELIKLEWQRRVNEETDQLKPQVRATLVALAGVHLPIELWALEGRQKAWVDPIRGQILKRAPSRAKAIS